MIRKFRAIVQSRSEPEDKQVLWVKHDSLSYYNNGEWVPLMDTPVIGEMVEIINDRVDKNLRQEVDSIRRDISNIIENEIKFQVTLANTNVIIENGRTLTLSDYNKIEQGKITAPVYIKEEDAFYKVTKIELVTELSTPPVYTFTCILEDTSNSSYLSFNVCKKNFIITESDNPELFNVQDVTDNSSPSTKDTFMIPLRNEGLDFYIQGAGFSSREDFIDAYSNYYYLDLDSDSKELISDTIRKIRARVLNKKMISLTIKYKNKQYNNCSVDVVSPNTKIEVTAINNTYSNTNLALGGFKFVFKSINGQWLYTDILLDQISLHTAGNPLAFLAEDGVYKEIESISDTTLNEIFNS